MAIFDVFHESMKPKTRQEALQTSDKPYSMNLHILGRF
jgi:hypothetical protein